MILLPWYFFALACMASFAIACVLLSLLTSGKMDEMEWISAGLREEIETVNKRADGWKMLAEMYHEGIHKQAGIDNDE